MPHLTKFVKFLSKSSYISIISLKAHMYVYSHPKKYHFGTGCSIKNRYNNWLTYWSITQLHVSSVQGQMFIGVIEHLNMPQYRGPVVHKICSRKLNGYMFILKNIINEKLSLDKSLSIPIRRVIQQPSSAKISYFCCFKMFSAQSTINSKFQHD